MLVKNTVWVTVSPKKGVLSQMALRANEIKLLIDENFDPANVPDYVMIHHKIYIQPVNGEHTINGVNLRRCIELQQRFPNWIVSPQMHKVVEYFTKERIR